MPIRIITDIFIFIAILHGWWFVALPIAFLSVWNFPYFLEFVLAGIIYDSLFGLIPELGILGYVGTIISTMILIASGLLKKVIRD